MWNPIYISFLPYNPFHDDTIAIAIAAPLSVNAPYLFTLNPFIATIPLPLPLPLPSLKCERTFMKVTVVDLKRMNKNVK